MSEPAAGDSGVVTVAVAIIGGGYSGGAIAYHLAHQPWIAPGDVAVFEPRARLGAGLAYDTADPSHRINVPAARMSLLPDQVGHFEDWIVANAATADDPEAANGDDVFPRRRVFGDYLDACIRPLVDNGRLRHLQTPVVSVERAGDAWEVTGADGSRLSAGQVVIATSHPSPQAPAALRSALSGHPRFIADATVADALSPIRADDRVLVVGNGLTSADVIASLTRQGHRGPITAISRRGLRSRGHAPFAQDPFGTFADRPAQTARQLLRRVRTALAQAGRQGLTWHAVLDALRAQGQEIWKTLSIDERRRLVRHVRPFWDVHRFRIAPQVEKTIADALESGRLRTMAASVSAVRRDGETITVTVRPRRGGVPVTIDVDSVVVTTGPGHGGILKSQQWLAGLAARGFLCPDPAELGLACDRESRALGRDGHVVPGLFIAGPLARGTFGELMGLPQVTENAAFVADRVAEALRPASAKTRCR